MLKLALVLILTLQAACPALAGAGLPPAGVWEGSAWMHKFRIGCLRENNATIRGVMLIDWWNGQPSPYHFRGQLLDDGRTFRARHYQGHHGQGRVLDDATIEFTVTARDGRTLTVQAHRIPGMLPDSTGAPQPW